LRGLETAPGQMPGLEEEGVAPGRRSRVDFHVLPSVESGLRARLWMCHEVKATNGLRKHHSPSAALAAAKKDPASF